MSSPRSRSFSCCVNRPKPSLSRYSFKPEQQQQQQQQGHRQQQQQQQRQGHVVYCVTCLSSQNQYPVLPPPTRLSSPHLTSHPLSSSCCCSPQRIALSAVTPCRRASYCCHQPCLHLFCPPWLPPQTHPHSCCEGEHPQPSPAAPPSCYCCHNHLHSLPLPHPQLLPYLSPLSSSTKLNPHTFPLAAP